MILPARKPTFGRWKKLSGTKYSLLRGLEYERIDGLSLPGQALDVGGGEHNSYWPLLRAVDGIDSINIDPRMEPTYLADLNLPWPFHGNQYDSILCLNTLEHIYRDQFVLCEMHRVLRPGGVAFIAVPYLYRVHGSPDDYHRHTASAWLRMLDEAGFDVDNCTVEPLAFGRLTSGLALTEFMIPLPARWAAKKVLMLLTVCVEVVHELTRMPRMSEMDVPLGYFITATKPLARGRRARPGARPRVERPGSSEKTATP
jgi:SAM-dependent methyltransferase